MLAQHESWILASKDHKKRQKGRQSIKVKDQNGKEKFRRLYFWWLKLQCSLQRCHRQVWYFLALEPIAESSQKKISMRSSTKSKEIMNRTTSMPSLDLSSLLKSTSKPCFPRFFPYPKNFQFTSAGKRIHKDNTK